MPLIYPETQSAGPSRKRPYAEITKSESPDTGPTPPAKRRRTGFSTPAHMPPSDITNQHSDGYRFAGDGFDYRRPVMSAHDEARSQENTIDLTLEDDTPVSAVSHDRPRYPLHQTPTREQHMFRAPPFPMTSTQPEIIDLSLLDDDDPPDRTAHLPVVSSPELEIVGERPRAATNIPLPPPGHASRILPRPTPYLGSLAEIIRGATRDVFGGTLRHDRDMENLASFRGMGQHTGHTSVTYDTAANLTIYEEVHLDYGAAGLQLGGNEPQQGQPDRTYKAPVAARTGYTRTYDEDDMLVCGFCGDELAAGDDEVKAQVWIIKQCGHAYCGTCAQGRVIGKGGAAKDRKRAMNKNGIPFKICTVPSCGKAVDSKTKMFQIYL